MGSDAAMSQLILKRASASRPSGEWNDDDFDMVANGAVVGRIMKVHAAPVGSPWMWTLAFGQHEDRTPRHGYAATREAAMTAFAESWRARSLNPRSFLADIDLVHTFRIAGEVHFLACQFRRPR